MPRRVFENNEVKFTVIDLDVYDTNALQVFVDAIEENNFPLIPFESKSGGLHLYVFFKEFVSAQTAVELTRQLATLLSIDTYIKRVNNTVYEVFPKQNKLTAGAAGNWINLPYYDTNKSERQKAVVRGKKLPLDEMLTYAKGKLQTLDSLREFIQEIPYRDAPPCIQTLSILNPFGDESNRNEFLFSFGIYLKKKDEQYWEQMLYDVNSSLHKPLSGGELEQTIISSLRKRDYQYKCKQPPICDYCNRNLCRTREYGVGKEDGYFSILEYGKMYQIQTNEPYYEWEIRLQGADEWKRLRFSSEQDIIKQDAFLSKCFRELHTLPPKLKQTQWFKIVNQSLNEIEEMNVHPDDDMSPMTMLKGHMFEFFFNRAKATRPEEITMKRAYVRKKDRMIFFRARDLLEYLVMSKNFRYYTMTELHGVLRDIGAEPSKLWIAIGEKKRQLRVLGLPITAAKNFVEEYQVRDQAEEGFEPDFEAFDEEDY